uniref:Uncharacterized protein n=1 Tax=Lepeophtheirus salmonis TaxID=72036 RepID=A0A0K2UDH6_LEPSM
MSITTEIVTFTEITKNFVIFIISGGVALAFTTNAISTIITQNRSCVVRATAG